MRPKPNIPKNIVAKVTVNTNLSFSVILCSSFIIKKRSVVGAPDLSSFFSENLSVLLYNWKYKNGCSLRLYCTQKFVIELIKMSRPYRYRNTTKEKECEYYVEDSKEAA